MMTKKTKLPSSAGVADHPPNPFFCFNVTNPTLAPPPTALYYLHVCNLEHRQGQICPKKIFNSCLRSFKFLGS